jgi:hypothetical protein
MKCRSRELININPAHKSDNQEKNSSGFPDTLVDYLSGVEIPFTNRDNIRQKLMKVLVEEKGYNRDELSVDREIRFGYEGRQACSPVDISIVLGDKTLIVFKCAPGSVVSRERQIIATARLLERYVIPFAVVTNGVDIELIDVLTENVIGEGIDSVPTREELSERTQGLILKPVNSKKKAHEQNILYTYDAMTCTLYRKSKPEPE